MNICSLTLLVLITLFSGLTSLSHPSYIDIDEKRSETKIINVIVTNIEKKTINFHSKRNINNETNATYKKELNEEYFKFIILLSDHELANVSDVYLGMDYHRFHCMDFVIKYILKHQINKMDFIRKNCHEISVIRINYQNMRLLKSELETDPTDEIFDERGSCHCSSKTTDFTELENDFNYEGLFEEETGPLNRIEFEGNYRNISGVSVPEFEDPNYDIEFIEKDALLKELSEAIRLNHSNDVDYSGLDDLLVSNTEIKNALIETEKRIDLKKANIRSDNKDKNLSNRKLKMSQENPEFSDNLSIENTVDLARKLTRAVTKSKEHKIRTCFTTEVEGKIFTSIIEFLYIYSIIEAEYDEIVKNHERKKAELKSFFDTNSNIRLINSVFGRLVGRYDESILKKVYSVADCTRFFMNIITPIAKQALPSERLVNKLMYTCELTFPFTVNDDQRTELYEECTEDREGNEHLYDSDIIGYLITKNFSLENTSIIVKKSIEMIIANRREIPIDRPSECYKKIKNIFLNNGWHDLSPENELTLRNICAKTYGLIGFFTTLDEN